MYQEFYGLKEPPFSQHHDSRFFYQNQGAAQTFHVLSHWINHGEGFIALYGNAGTGKTTLCRTVLESVGPNIYTTMITNPFLSDEDLLRAILKDFGVVSPDAPQSTRKVTKADLTAALNTFLASLKKLNAHAVIVIDEVETIPVATMEQIRVLSNLDAVRQKLLKIVLVGRPDPKEVLDRPELRQLNQEISTRCELLPFTLEDTAAYIQHRLRLVIKDPRRFLFNPDAIQFIHEHSGGIPKQITRMAEDCLVYGASTQQFRIDVKTAEKAVFQPDTSKPITEKRSRKATVTLAALLLVLVATLAILWFGRFIK